MRYCRCVEVSVAVAHCIEVSVAVTSLPARFFAVVGAGEVVLGLGFFVELGVSFLAGEGGGGLAVPGLAAGMAVGGGAVVGLAGGVFGVGFDGFWETAGWWWRWWRWRRRGRRWER